MKKVHQPSLKLEMDSSKWLGTTGPLGKCGLMVILACIYKEEEKLFKPQTSTIPLNNY